jgi:hypothetical protein
MAYTNTDELAHFLLIFIASYFCKTLLQFEDKMIYFLNPINYYISKDCKIIVISFVNAIHEA